MNLFALDNFPLIHIEPNQDLHFLKINNENALLGEDELKNLAHGAHLLYTAITLYLNTLRGVSNE